MSQEQVKVAPSTTANGVDVGALMETIEAVKAVPEIADFTFRVNNKWLVGDHNRTTITGFHGACEDRPHEKGPFVMDNAEPPVLLGEGAAPNPVEYLLHALAGCLTTSIVYHAAARGIEVTNISSKLEGDLDLHGFLGLDDSVRKGFETVRATIKVKTDADAETLQSLAQFSPVYEMVSRSLPVHLRIEVQ